MPTIPRLTIYLKWCILINNMRKVILFASNFICLAEHSLSGLKAWARRVMAEWLKTPCLVSSRDQSFIDIGHFLENCGCVPTNPTADAYCLLIYNKNRI